MACQRYAPTALLSAPSFDWEWRIPSEAASFRLVGERLKLVDDGHFTVGCTQDVAMDPVKFASLHGMKGLFQISL